MNGRRFRARLAIAESRGEDSPLFKARGVCKRRQSGLKRPGLARERQRGEGAMGARGQERAMKAARGSDVKIKTMALAAALGAALMGCAAVDHSREPKAPTIEQGWRAPAPELAASWGTVQAGSAGWWRGFGDAGLGAFVEAALESNKGLQASAAAAKAGRELNKAVEASVFPQANLSASQTRQRQEADGGSQSLRYSSFGAGASWELPLYGQVELARSSKEAADAAQTYGLEAAKSALAYQAVQAYLAWKLSGQALLAYQTQERIGELEEKAARAGVASGLSTPQRLDAVRAQLSLDRSGVEQALADERMAREAMRALAGGQWMEKWEAGDPMPSFKMGVALSLPAEAARQRPDVRRAEAQAWVALGADASARSEGLPKLALQGVIQIALGGAIPGSPARAVVSAMTPTLSMPLWDWGMSEAKKRKASFELDQALAAYQESVIQAVREMESALIEAHRARIAREQAFDRLAISANQEERANRDFKAGLIAPLDVWGSARAHSRDRLVSAQASYAEGLAVAFLHKAMASTAP